MNIQQLESFIQVAENLSFARAAEVLNMTQSAVSRQISSLENELGASLFHRSTRTVSLTPAGISFLDDAKDVVKRLQVASLRMRTHSQSNIHILSIGCSNEASLLSLDGVLRRCRTQMPQLHPFIRVIPYRSILTLFIHGEIDVIFGFRDDLPGHDGIFYRELAQIPICCAVSSAHPYAAKSELPEEVLFSESFILCNSYEIPSGISGIQNRLEKKFLPGHVYYCENLQVMLSLVRTGYGIAVLPEATSTDPETVYVPLAGSSPLSYGVFYKNVGKNPLVRQFISIVLQEASEG